MDPGSNVDLDRGLFNSKTELFQLSNTMEESYIGLA